MFTFYFFLEQAHSRYTKTIRLKIDIYVFKANVLPKQYINRLVQIKKYTKDLPHIKVFDLPEIINK